MTRSLPARARRVTQPIVTLQQRDPSIESLGFRCFRLLQMSGAGLMPVVFGDHRNAMSAFVRAR